MGYSHLGVYFPVNKLLKRPSQALIIYMTFKNELTVDEWIKEMGCMYTAVYVLFRPKKKEILSFMTTWMDLEGVMP